MTLVVDRSVLSAGELMLLDRVERDPEVYRTHFWVEHNALVHKHRRCVLCLVDSVVVFENNEPVVPKVESDQ